MQAPVRTLAPILFGIDMFAEVMTHWTKYGVVALRDFGLLLGALTMGRLATAHERGQLPS
jgi:hypothetical protein